MIQPLVLTQVRKQYRTFTLGPIDLTVQRGYVTGVIGANGAGKTTIIKIATGAVRRFDGSVSLPDKTRIGVVLDTPYWIPDWKASQLVDTFSPWYPVWNRELFWEIADWAGVSEHTKLKELSRGMGMRLQLAVAMAHEPELLLLDEPTSGLDPKARTEMLDRIADFMTDERHAVLLSSNISSDLDRIADRIVILDHGQVMTSGETTDLLESWAVVRGPSASLSPGLAEHLRGLRQHRVGWDALLPAEQLALCDQDVVAEPPTIENLFIRLTQETSHV